MKFTKLFPVLASLSIFASGTAMAQTYTQSATKDLAVSANVKTSCTIDTVGVTFPDYDPTAGTAVNNNEGSVKIKCSKGSVTPIGLDLGKSPNGTRQMKGPSASGSDYLSYELYKAPNDVWGNASGSWLIPPASPKSTAWATFAILATIGANQDVSVGAYTDTVTATVNF